MVQVRILSGSGNEVEARVTDQGELVTARLAKSTADSVDCNVVDAAFNFSKFLPRSGQQFVITGAIISGNRDIGVNGSVFEVYTADSATSTTVITTLIPLEVAKSRGFTPVIQDLVAPEGEFLNAKCDDDAVKAVLYGYFEPVGKSKE